MPKSKKLDEFKPLKEYKMILIEKLDKIIFKKLENLYLESPQQTCKIKRKKPVKNVIRLFNKVKKGEPMIYETQGHLKDIQNYNSVIKTQKSIVKNKQKLKIKKEGKYEKLNGLVIFDTNYILNIAEKEKKKAYSELITRPEARFDLDFKDAKIIKGIFLN